jgi:signal transduction histidine kinase
MDQDFIDKELFAPFASTKGVSGMGIGAYQVREYVRSIGGEMLVSSTPGKGTAVVLKLPLVADD